jgi:phosphate-selective porin
MNLFFTFVATALLALSTSAAAQSPQPDPIPDSRIACNVWNERAQRDETAGFSWSGNCQNGYAQGQGVLQ